MNFKERTKETLRKGEETRGDFTPDPSSAPAKLYRYWLANTNSRKGKRIVDGLRKENFCHYWRVVMFWAPLMWVINNIIATKTMAVISGIAATIAVVGSFFFMSNPGKVIITILAVIGVAVVVALAGLVWVVTWEKVEDKWPNFASKIEDAVPFVVASLVGTLIVILVAGAFIDGLGWIAGLIWFSVFVAAGALITFGVFTLDKYLDGKAAQRKEEWNAMSLEDQIKALESAVVIKPPGKVKKFFIGLGQFITLVSQIVRVNKWKICPIVNVPK